MRRRGACVLAAAVTTCAFIVTTKRACGGPQCGRSRHFTQPQSADEVLARASGAIEGHLAEWQDVGGVAPEDGAILMGEVHLMVYAG